MPIHEMTRLLMRHVRLQSRLHLLMRLRLHVRGLHLGSCLHWRPGRRWLLLQLLKCSAALLRQLAAP